MITSPSQLIKNLGAPKIAAELDLPPGAVRAWKHKNKIPRGRWPELMEAFPDLTIDRLKVIEAVGEVERLQKEKAA